MNFVRCCQCILIALALTACGKWESPEPKTGEAVGISFKSGKGLRISDETKKIIGLEIVEASEQKLAAEFSAPVQVYGHGDSPGVTKSDRTNAYATGFVSAEQAKGLKPEQPVTVKLTTEPHTQLQATIVRVNRFTESALHRTEVLIELSDPQQQFKTGTEFQVTFTSPDVQSVTAIPRSAVLQTSEGAFTYVVNGDYFFRTAIKTGAESKDFVEVKDGLYSGDQIVKQPVRTLWIAELQAIKGGADND